MQGGRGTVRVGHTIRIMSSTPSWPGADETNTRTAGCYRRMAPPGVRACSDDSRESRDEMTAPVADDTPEVPYLVGDHGDAALAPAPPPPPPGKLLIPAERALAASAACMDREAPGGGPAGAADSANGGGGSDACRDAVGYAAGGGSGAGAGAGAGDSAGAGGWYASRRTGPECGRNTGSYRSKTGGLRVAESASAEADENTSPRRGSATTDALWVDGGADRGDTAAAGEPATAAATAATAAVSSCGATDARSDGMDDTSADTMAAASASCCCGGGGGVGTTTGAGGEARVHGVQRRRQPTATKWGGAGVLPHWRDPRLRNWWQRGRHERRMCLWRHFHCRRRQRTRNWRRWWRRRWWPRQRRRNGNAIV